MAAGQGEQNQAGGWDACHHMFTQPRPEDIDGLEDDPGARWSDVGYWLAWPVALLTLLWFRKGWTVRWGTAVLVWALLSVGAPASAGAAELRFADLWLTPDQQGRYWMERGELLKAAERFEDPMWKGLAYYYAEDFMLAAEYFSRSDSDDALFDEANARTDWNPYDGWAALVDAGYARALTDEEIAVVAQYVQGLTE